MLDTSHTINEASIIQQDLVESVYLDYPKELQSKVDENVELLKSNENKKKLPSDPGHHVSISACYELFGRHKERAEILQCYDDMKEGGPNTLVLISGPTGVGKTILAESLREANEEGKPYCVSVSFDSSSEVTSGPQVMRNALEMIIEAILTRGDKAIQAVKVAVEAADDIDIALLVELVPSLKRICGDHHGEVVLSRLVDHSHRKSLLIGAFFQAVCSPANPVILILNNIQAADSTAIGILRTLLTGTRKCMFFVGSCRQLTGAAKSLFDKLPTDQYIVKNIELCGFDEVTTGIMVSGHLQATPKACSTVSRCVFEYSNGNPLFILESLRFLCRAGLVSVDSSCKQWTCNPQLVDEVMQNFKDLRDLVTERLSLETGSVQELLKVAACLGPTLNEKLMSIALSAPVSHYVEIAADQGLLVFNESEQCYCFASSVVHEASYSLIPLDELPTFHLAIGRKIWRGLGDELPIYVPVILAQMNHGITLVSNPKEKYALATFHLQTAQNEAKASNFAAASVLLEGAVRLLGENSWSEQYDLSLSIFNSAAEVEYTRGNFEMVYQYIGNIFKNAASLEDKLQAQTTKVYTLIANDKLHEATDVALKALALLGETFPSRPSRALIWFEFMKTSRILRGQSDEKILRLKTMTDPRQGAAMQLMHMVFSSTYVSNPMICPMICFRMIRLSLSHGLCAISSFAFTTYGMLLCSYNFNFRSGYNYGLLGLKILDKFGAKEWLPRVYAGFYGLIHGWSRPMASALEPLSRSVQVALHTGDFEFACLNSHILYFMLFDLGKPLQELKAQMLIDRSNEIRMMKQETFVKMDAPFMYMIDALIGDHDHVRVGRFDSKYGMTDNYIHCHNCAINYIYGNFEHALAEGELAQRLGDPPYKSVDFAFGILFHGLASLAVYQTSGKNSRKLIGNAKRHIRVLEKISQGAPEYVLGKLFLLKAELSAVRGHVVVAHQEFVAAISIFSKGGLLMDLAVANERAGRFMKIQGDISRATAFIKEAQEVFEKWGAKSKARMLLDELASRW